MANLDYNTERKTKSFLAFAEIHNELRKKFRIPHVITQSDIDKIDNCRFIEGSEITQEPRPSDPESALNLLKDYYAEIQFAYQKHLFEERWIVWNESTISKELVEIGEWIKIAKSNERPSKEVTEYNRFIDKFYEGYLMDYSQLNDSSVTAAVYGRYFLFYEYLKNELLKFSKLKEEEIKDNNNEIDKSKTDPARGSDKWEKLIKSELHDHLKKIESKIESKLSNWKQRVDLIECAAFCQLLFDLKYFESGSTCRKTVISFALSKYGTDIENQLESSKKAAREVHKKLLKVNFK
ncbi:MAG: hypothetical protein JWR61_5661 [Ferruginibacter sp.]|uniref:hypothetical protein n=1 Tax=Ferruginibacter sp. TaxID=1940288 RepID=UPI00265B24C5|nr:hypothetical protein [Ferruginibacter sp.]MDB5280706.1 hypothetical protein [Ferruginibacter sp.]